MAYRKFKHIGTKLVEDKDEIMLEQMMKGGKILRLTPDDAKDMDITGKNIDEVIEMHKSDKADKAKIQIRKSLRARKSGEKEQQAIIICVKHFNQYKPGDEVRVFSLDQADPGKSNHIEKAKMFCEKNKGKLRIKMIEL